MLKIIFKILPLVSAGTVDSIVMWLQVLVNRFMPRPIYTWDSIGSD